MFAGAIAILLLAAGLAAPSPTPSPDPDSIKFGLEHAAIWDDNVEASVTSAKTFTPTANAVGLAPGETGVKITIKITNGTATAFDLSGAVVRLKSGPDGVQAAQIFDIESGLSLGFEGVIAPGRPATATYGFSVPPGDTDLLDVEVTPATSYKTALFSGSAS